MDRAGVREVFYAECGSAPDYGVRKALRTLPFNCRYLESFFFGLHLPLTRPLPKRLDTRLQSRPCLHRYDAIVLVDVDPVVLDAEDLLNLEAYVEAGGGLLLMAGPNSFSRAQRGWGPVKNVLPVGMPFLEPLGRRTPDEHSADVAPQSLRLLESHPTARGLSGSLGLARPFDPIAAKKGATVIAAAEDDTPVIVVGAYGKGRVVIVNAEPQAMGECMFKSAGWSDLARQLLAWLMGRDADLAIARCLFDVTPMHLGGSRTFTVDVVPEFQAPFEVKTFMSRADPGWLSVGREPRFDEEAASDVSVDMNSIACRVQPSAPGLWRVRIEMRGKDWANVRQAQIHVESPIGLKLSVENGEYTVAPEREFPLRIEAKGVTSVCLKILDFDCKEVWRREKVPVGSVNIPLPNLELGEYEIVAETREDQARLRFCVTNPVRSVPFSIVGLLSGSTEEQIDWWYNYFRSRGFNAFSTALTDSDAIRSVESGFRPTAYAHYVAQRDGLNLWGEYTVATLLRSRGAYDAEGSSPPSPCVRHPDHAVQLRELLTEKYRLTSMLPRMVALNILDEPHFYRSRVCHCALCREAYLARHGYDMPTWDEAIVARDHRTRDYFEWVIDYMAEGFRMGYDIWKSLGADGPRLNHVLCAIGSGGRSANSTIAEDAAWAEHADFIEFDCYNYMYAHWRPVHKLRWNEFHYLMGHFRFLALRNKQRLGFFIQVTDRDIPVAPADPLRAPSETLYTAIGGGAKTFHLMHKGPFDSAQNCREDKFDAFAEDVRKIQTVAPLLDRAEAPRRRVAMAFPFHDRLYRLPELSLPAGYIGMGHYGAEHYPYDTKWPFHASPINVAELMVRAFGEVDVIDQRVLREDPLLNYDAFVLTTTDYIEDADGEAIVRFVDEGGLLICDHVPTHNLEGKHSDILAPLFAGHDEHFYRDIMLRRSSVGKGRALLFSSDLNEMYTQTFENDENPRLRALLEETVRQFLFDEGLRPHTRSSNVEIEANVLLTPDTVVLVAVSHADMRQQSEITLFAPSVPVCHVYDLVTMEPYPFERVGDDIQIEVDLCEREGRVFGLYAEVPTCLTITPDATDARPGGHLAFDVTLTDSSQKQVRGDHLVEVRVVDAAGTERRQFGGRHCTRNGLLRINELLAINARTGTWTITAFDHFTTQHVEAHVTVSEV